MTQTRNTAQYHQLNEFVIEGDLKKEDSAGLFSHKVVIAHKDGHKYYLKSVKDELTLF